MSGVTRLMLRNANGCWIQLKMIDDSGNGYGFDNFAFATDERRESNRIYWHSVVRGRNSIFRLKKLFEMGY